MRRTSFAWLALFVVAIVAAAWWFRPALDGLGMDDHAGNLAQTIRSWGHWGVAGSIGLMVAHSFVPFPAEVIALANGMAYGALWGTVITWTGAMLGASAAFAVGRTLGRPFVERMLRDSERVRLAAWTSERGAFALLIGRLIPVIAFNLINYAASLTPVSWWTFLWTTGLGILPFTIALCAFGSEMMSAPTWAWLLVAALALAAWILMRRYRQRAAKRRAGPIR